MRRYEIAGLGARCPVFALAGDPDARTVADAGRDADVHVARLAVVRDRKTARRAAEGIFERQLDLLFDVAPLARRPAASAASPRRPGARPLAAAEEGVEEIGERIGVSEHALHLFRRHRAESAAARSSAAAAVFDVPARRRAGARPGLFVRAPVRAELVVLLPLVGIAEHLVRLVDFLELRFGGLVTLIDVRMVLARELAERLLDFFISGRFGDAER